MTQKDVDERPSTWNLLYFLLGLLILSVLLLILVRLDSLSEVYSAAGTGGIRDEQEQWQTHELPATMTWPATNHAVARNKTSQRPHSPRPVCVNDGCRRFSKVLQQNMDAGVDPCDDFFKYACGGFQKKFATPYSMPADLMVRTLAEFKSSILRAQNNSAEEEASKFVAFCLESASRGPSDFREVVDDLGGVPVFQPLPPHRVNAAFLMLNGFGVPMFTPMQYKNSPLVTFTMNRNYALNEKIFSSGAARAFIVQLAKDFNAYNDSDAMLAELDAFVGQLQETNKVMASYVQLDKRNKKAYRTSHPDKLLAQAGFKGLRKPGDFNQARIRGSNSLKQVLNHTHLATHDISDFARFRVLFEYRGLMGKNYEAFAFSSTYLTKTTCMQETIKFFPRFFDAWFWNHMAHNPRKSTIDNIYFNVRDAFVNMVEKNLYLEEATKQMIYERIRNTTISYQGFAGIQTNEELTKTFKTHTYHSSSTYGEFLHRHFRTTTLLVPNYPHSVIVNAYNTMNHLEFYLTLFAEPLFAVDYPLEAWYGILGYIMGHEMGHNFDADRLHKENMFGDDFEQFMNRVNCLIDTFNGTKIISSDDYVYTQEAKHSIIEIMSDSYGLRASLEAYHKELIRIFGDLRKAPALPELEHLSGDQVYFISTAQFYCSNDNAEILKIHEMNVHPPGKIRVNHNVKNYKEFASVFKCKPETPMNPAKKCQIFSDQFTAQYAKFFGAMRA